MDWKKFKVIATLLIFCFEELCDYIVDGEDAKNSSCSDRIYDAMGAAQMMIDEFREDENN